MITFLCPVGSQGAAVPPKMQCDTDVLAMTRTYKILQVHTSTLHLLSEGTASSANMRLGPAAASFQVLTWARIPMVDPSAAPPRALMGPGPAAHPSNAPTKLPLCSTAHQHVEKHAQGGRIASYAINMHVVCHEGTISSNLSKSMQGVIDFIMQ